MNTTQNRFFDELARLMTNAAGAAQGVRREFDTLVQTQMERVLNNMELVKRDDFEAVKAMAQKAREENDSLAARIAALEEALSQSRAEMAAAVEETHRSYRRDLVPLRQSMAPFGDAAEVLRRLSGR